MVSVQQGPTTESHQHRARQVALRSSLETRPGRQTQSNLSLPYFFSIYPSFTVALAETIFLNREVFGELMSTEILFLEIPQDKLFNSKHLTKKLDKITSQISNFYFVLTSVLPLPLNPLPENSESVCKLNNLSA